MAIVIQTWNCFGAAQGVMAFLRGRGAVDAHRFQEATVATSCDEADILCVQELWLAEAAQFFRDRPHHHKREDTNGNTLLPLAFAGSGLGLATRFVIQASTFRRFTPPHVGAERFARKAMQHARIHAVGEGMTLDVINTHLQSGTTDGAVRVRIRQLHELAALIREVTSIKRTALVCGDLNVDGNVESSADSRALRDLLSDFEDLGRAEGLPTFHPADNDLASREGKNAPAQRLDYILFRAPKVSSEVRVDRLRRTLDLPFASAFGKRTYASDHAALRVVLRSD